MIRNKENINYNKIDASKIWAHLWISDIVNNYSGGHSIR